jgi:heavy metal sensor kinase
MAIPLGTKLTVWYSALLLLALAAFTGTVLWLDWHLMLRQADESLDSLGRAAANVVTTELGEGVTIEEATREMLNVVHQKNSVLAVLDETGLPLVDVVTPRSVRLPWAAAVHGTRTVTATDGEAWRVLLRPQEAGGHRFIVAIATPFHEIEEHWQLLARACALGVPIVMLGAAAGGWWLGQRGLRPLAAIARQARDITAQTPATRLTAEGAGPELDAVAVSFNRVLDRLGSALSTQRRFMADASHELRTPVSIMRTAADVTLGQSRRDVEEYHDALVAISEQSVRLTRLVDDMLVLARADDGGYPIVRADLDLDVVVEQCVREFRPQAQARNIALTSQVQPASYVGDAALLRRLLGNLVGNALTYTPAGGGVEVTMVSGMTSISIRVADTGPGIPLEDRERVFERFVRLDPARTAGGAGLGLSIARWVAEAHGGRVTVLDSGPHGSVFEAAFPIGPIATS